MGHQNDDRYYNKKSWQKSRARRRIRYGSVCVALCLLMVGTAFGIANLLKDSKAPPIQEKGITGSNEGYFQEDHRQNEAVSPTPGASNFEGSISEDVAAKNIVVMNAGTNTVLYQKKQYRQDCTSKHS